jgi:hypothetical protein
MKEGLYIRRKTEDEVERMVRKRRKGTAFKSEIQPCLFIYILFILTPFSSLYPFLLTSLPSLCLFVPSCLPSFLPYTLPFLPSVLASFLSSFPSSLPYFLFFLLSAPFLLPHVLPYTLPFLPPCILPFLTPLPSLRPFLPYILPSLTTNRNTSASQDIKFTAGLKKTMKK